MRKLEQLLPLLEPESLRKRLDTKTMEAGEELHRKKAVSDLVSDANRIRGKIKGSHPEPHQTQVSLVGSDTLEASCTCPTFTDGWTKFCHHAVCLALGFREQYRAGAEITTTQNP